MIINSFQLKAKRKYDNKVLPICFSQWDWAQSSLSAFSVRFLLRKATQSWLIQCNIISDLVLVHFSTKPALNETWVFWLLHYVTFTFISPWWQFVAIVWGWVACLENWAPMKNLFRCLEVLVWVSWRGSEWAVCHPTLSFIFCFSKLSSQLLEVCHLFVGVTLYSLSCQYICS